MSYDFGIQLLACYSQADETIVLPAILLHDVGWKSVPEEMQSNAFGPNATDKAANRLHEIEGVKIAREILADLEYDREKIQEILEIINGHDSRLEALSLNDQLVKDADKLWRFSAIGVKIDSQRFFIERAVRINFLQGKIDQWFFTPEAKTLARLELAAQPFGGDSHPPPSALKSAI
jgi:hypothetical protein